MMIISKFKDVKIGSRFEFNCDMYFLDFSRTVINCRKGNVVQINKDATVFIDRSII